MLRETIRHKIDHHLDCGYMVMGQCLNAVGFVGGTLPERHDMTELPMADVAGSAFAVGAALAGKRPILVVRYQGFQWLGGWSIANYAAKSYALWNQPCPMLVRSVAMEGRIGPVAGSSHHALFYRMPGLNIYSPMTSSEWLDMYSEFMLSNEVFYASEHRGSWGFAEELPDILQARAEMTLYPISITRFAAIEAANELTQAGVPVNVVNIRRLKPAEPTLVAKYSRLGMVLDDDYPDGVAKSIAFDIQRETGTSMSVLGLREATAGFAGWSDVLPPSTSRIVAAVLSELDRK